MYQTIMLDGKEIKIRTSLDEKETGIIIENELEDTDDLQEIVDYINQNINNDEENTNE